jgi:hypothetical protein
LNFLFLTMKGFVFHVIMVNYPKLFAATDIKIWHGRSGKELGTVDTNQLKNNMADISPNGRFIAAAAFTADVKVSYVAGLTFLSGFNLLMTKDL